MSKPKQQPSSKKLDHNSASSKPSTKPSKEKVPVSKNKKVPKPLRKKMQRKETQLVKKRKEISNKLSTLKQKSRAKLASFLPKVNERTTYLNKAGKFDVEKVRKLRDVIPLRIVMELPPKIIRAVYFKKSKEGYSFDPPTKKLELYINLKTSFRDKPEIRGGWINGLPVQRRGYAGSFYYVKNGIPYSYGAIYGNMTFKPGKIANKSELAALDKKFPKATPKQRRFVDDAAKRLYPGQAKLAAQLLLRHAREEGLNPDALAKAIEDSKKTKDYPSGIVTLTGAEPMGVLISWYATLMATREQQFKASAKPGQLKKSDGSYTKEFLSFSKSGQFAKKTKLRKDYYKRWSKREKLSYKRETTIHSDLMGKMKPERHRFLKRLMYKDPLRQLPAGAFAGAETLKEVKGQLKGRWWFPSGGIFAGSHLFSEKRVEQLRGKEVTMDLIFPGIRGSARGRQRSTYRGNENRVGVGVEDAFPMRHREKRGRNQAIYLWRNMMSLPIDQRKKKFELYISGLVTALEGTGMKIKDCTLSGHSGGGRMLHMIAEMYPNGEIPFTDGKGKRRTLKINGYFAADSHYFENTELFHTYFSHQFKREVMKDQKVRNLVGQLRQGTMGPDAIKQVKAKLAARVKVVCDRLTVVAIYEFLRANSLSQTSTAALSKAFDRYSENPQALLKLFSSYTADTAISMLLGASGNFLLNARQRRTRTSIPHRMVKSNIAIQGVITEKLVKGELASWQPPKYYATGLDTGWRHQARVHRWGYMINGRAGVKYIPIAGKSSHWKAYGNHVRDAFDSFKDNSDK